jgi:hypothetical protein
MMGVLKDSCRLLRGVLVALAVVCGGCSINFDEAIPCENNDQCPEDMVCVLSGPTGRCTKATEAGDVEADTASDVATDVVEDTTPIDTGQPDTRPADTAVDTAPEVPVDTGAELDTADTADAADTAADTGDAGDGDTCVPVAEVCNGLDDDCDGEPDNGIDCGTCPDPNDSPDSPLEATQGMVLVVRPGLDPFCIDLFEASRTDASIASEGTSTDGIAHSLRAVLPWSGATLAEAGAACTAAGKRLCTLEEWIEGCGGADGLRFPYGDTYNGAFCNGSEAGTGQAGATGSRFNCRGPDATFDMSGNLEEWVSDGPASHPTRGGAFDDVEPALRCSGSDDSAPDTPPGSSVGFRCCADTVSE